MPVEFKYDEVKNLFAVNEADEKDSTASGVEYKFSITRKKSNTTGLEKLEIKALVGDKCLGVIDATFPTLMDSLFRLTEYGVIVPRATFGKLAKAIGREYHKIPMELVDFDDDMTESRLNAILEMIYNSICDAEIKPEEIKGVTCYNVPVAEFNAWIADSHFYKIGATTVKRELTNNAHHYLCSNEGRYDRTIKRGDKTVKVISLYAQELAKFGKEMKLPKLPSLPKLQDEAK